jgi:hypothetical protein
MTKTVIGQIKDDLAGWRLGRCVWVVDRGFSSDENLRYLTRAGGHWIAGEKMRDGSRDARAALARQGRYRGVHDNLRVKEVTLPDGEPGRRFVVCHNPAEADRDRKKSATINWRGSRPSLSGSRRCANAKRASARTRHGARAPAAAPTRPGARRRSPAAPRGRTPRPSARCATTPPSAATCA